MTATEPELQTRAREAWALLTRECDPMPAWAALDYVQEACDDRRACFLVLCGIAADELDDFIHTVIDRAFGARGQTSRVLNAARLIRSGVLLGVLAMLDHISKRLPGGRPLNEWDRLWLIFVRVHTVLTALEVAL